MSNPNVKQKQCFKCGQTVYETGAMANKRDGTQFLQKFNEPYGKTPHYKTCSGRPQNTESTANTQFQGREASNTFVPEGYVQQQQPEEPFVARPQQSSTQDSEAIKKLGEDIKTMNVQIANIQQYQVGIDGLLAKVVQKLDLLLSASGVDEALGPKPLG